MHSPYQRYFGEIQREYQKHRRTGFGHLNMKQVQQINWDAELGGSRMNLDQRSTSKSTDKSKSSKGSANSKLSKASKASKRSKTSEISKRSGTPRMGPRDGRDGSKRKDEDAGGASINLVGTGLWSHGRRAQAVDT